MAHPGEWTTWAEDVSSRKKKWSELPRTWTEQDRARARLHAVSTWTGRHDLVKKIVKNGVINAASGQNCEQMIGELTLPLGVVGPVVLTREKGSEEYYVPLATTEGALVASVQRGMKAARLSGGIVSVAERAGVTRAPVLAVDSFSHGKAVRDWVSSHMKKLKVVTEQVSLHTRLLGIEPAQVGRNLYLRMRFDTSEAMGMNMVTIAAENIVGEIVSAVGGRCIALSGNACADKKPAWSNAVLGRGMRVSAETVVPTAVVCDVLKTTPEKIIDVVVRKDYIGSAVSGSMGFNGHYANMVAALFLATGQDLAHVVEGSLGITTAERTDNGLYFNVNLPDVMVGTVGGGTHLPVQHASLQMMHLGEGRAGEKERFAELVGAVVLAGELSLTAALASHDLAKAHRRLGRKQR